MNGDDRPLCFVLMPFGTKADSQGAQIDFDRVYVEVLAPAVEKADMTPVRGDEEQLGGMIHRAIFERLILCDYALADLTHANPNVLYELGIRHGVRPRTTVSVFAKGSRLPFDVAPLRCVPYSLEGGVPSDAAADLENIAQALAAATMSTPDSPVFQLLADLRPPELDHLKTDLFRDEVLYAEQVKAELARARAEESVAAVDAVQTRLGDPSTLDAGIAIDLLLSYRAVSGWEKMIELVDRMPEPLSRSVLVREQLGLALNRAGRSDEAERVLEDVIASNGPSSETYGLLGRVYKDRWERAVEDGNDLVAQGHLSKAIDAYRRGFEADWRDAYPGINAVTLMELANPPDPERELLLPVVLYSALRRMSRTPNYWDHATLLELEVLRNNDQQARRHAADALAATDEGWQLETTLRNLRLIRDARRRRGEQAQWLDQLCEEFDRA